MAVENEIENLINPEPSEAEKRITSLSGKVKEQAERAAASDTARAEAEAKATEAIRERDFYAGFTDVVGTNPAAKDHKDEILAKVKGGYTMEDATFAVLGKAGKLGPQQESSTTIAGGSASTTPPQGGQTEVSKMTQTERRAALMENEGDLARLLAPQNNM